MTLIHPQPLGSITICCPKCKGHVDYHSFTDGLMEAMGKEPYMWSCYSCKKSWRTSDVSKIRYSKYCQTCGIEHNEKKEFCGKCRLSCVELVGLNYMSDSLYKCNYCDLIIIDQELRRDEI